MPSTMQDFLAAYMNLEQMQRAKEMQAVQTATARAQQIAAAQQILSQTTDPSQQEQLISFFGPMLGQDGANLMRQLSQSTAPSIETTRARITAEQVPGLGQGAEEDIALAALGGGNRAQVAQSGTFEELFQQGVPGNIQEAWLSRTFAGLDPGQLAVSELLAGTPEAQRVAIGTELGAAQREGARQFNVSDQTARRGQDIQERLGGGNIDLGWASLLSKSAHDTAQLVAQRANAQQQMLAAQDDKSLEILAEISNIEKLIQQGNMNRDAIARNFMIMKDHYRRLVEAGYEQFRPMLDLDITEATTNTFVPGGIGNTLFGTRGPGNW